MYINEFESAMKACRFCFMCRHLSAVGNVLFSESDTPRGRALLLDKASMNPEFLFSDAVVETIYRSDLAANCRFHCVSHYDENSLVLAARRDIVEAGEAPEKVAAIAKKFQRDNEFKIEGGKADVLYFIDEYTLRQPEISAAFLKIARAAKVSVATITGGCIGKALRILGYVTEGKKDAATFAKKVAATGAKTLVVSNPAAYDALKNDFPAWGFKLPCKVMHSSEFIADLLKSKKLKAAAKKKTPVYYLESDFLKNYNDDVAAPHAVLEAVGFENRQFGTNNEESYSAGEGACVLLELNPELVSRLAKQVASRADNPKKDRILTASPYTRFVLKKETELKVESLEEAVAEIL